MFKNKEVRAFWRYRVAKNCSKPIFLKDNQSKNSSFENGFLICLSAFMVSCTKGSVKKNSQSILHPYWLRNKVRQDSKVRQYLSKTRYKCPTSSKSLTGFKSLTTVFYSSRPNLNSTPANLTHLDALALFLTSPNYTYVSYIY